MKPVISQIRAAIASTLVFAVVCCGFYPLAVTGIARLAFRDKADGSLIRGGDGAVSGSSLLGKHFRGERYFHSRPSANGHDAGNSGGSNLGPTSRKLADQIKERVAAYRSANGLDENQPVPADAVTASGSGLDPHISPANAALQAARVARARSLSLEKVQSLIAANTDKASFGFIGEDGVNVLKLNLALDSLMK
jgi:K+-transporting ATPase ATPase C chain